MFNKIMTTYDIHQTGARAEIEFYQADTVGEESKNSRMM